MRNKSVNDQQPNYIMTKQHLKLIIPRSLVYTSTKRLVIALNQRRNMFPFLVPKNICFYQKDGLAIIKNRSARLAGRTRKELHKVFEQFGLKITVEANLHVVNFLDVTFDLTIGKHKPYRTPNDDPLL